MDPIDIRPHFDAAKDYCGIFRTVEMLPAEDGTPTHETFASVILCMDDVSWVPEADENGDVNFAVYQIPWPGQAGLAESDPKVGAAVGGYRSEVEDELDDLGQPTGRKKVAITATRYQQVYRTAYQEVFHLPQELETDE